MEHSLSMVAFGHATSRFLAITFVLCLRFDLVFPQMAMYRSWQALLPGFTCMQLIELHARSRRELRLRMYVTLIWVPQYNVLSARGGR